jgi:hypothetical protein
MRALSVVVLLLAVTSAATARTILQDAAPSNGLPILGDLVLDGSAQVVIPGLSFSMTADLSWPVVPVENATDIVYQVTDSNGQVLASGTEPIADEDGTYISSLSISDMFINETGHKDVTLQVGWDTTFTESSTTSYTVWVIIGGKFFFENHIFGF